MLVSREQAIEEVNSWLDYKKISPEKREMQKDQIETLVGAICEGVLSLKEDHTFVHELKHPTEGEMKITKFEYKPRLRIAAVHSHLENSKPTPDARVVAYIAALTSQNKGVVGLLDTEDYGIAQSIAIFFL